MNLQLTPWLSTLLRKLTVKNKQDRSGMYTDGTKTKWGKKLDSLQAMNLCNWISGQQKALLAWN